MTVLRVAAAAVSLAPVATPHAWVDRIAARVRAGADAGARLIVLPEYVTAPLLALDRNWSVWTGLWHHTMLDLARRHEVTLLGGTHLIHEDGRWRNRALLIQDDGRVTLQDKLHPTPWERTWQVEATDRLHLERIAGTVVATLTCYDVEFPELARRAAQAGAEVLLVPSWTDDAQGFHRVRTCAAARCIEDLCYVIHAPLVGTSEVPEFEQACGAAGILTPADLGFPPQGLATVGGWGEQVTIVADLDLAALRRLRQGGTVKTLADARNAEHYQVDLS